MGADLTILVTGANGQLGREIRDLATHFPNIRFRFFGREDLPLENFQLLREVFSLEKPDVCLNCAAYTAVDHAENYKDLAFLINGEAVGVLASICAEYHCRFIHISTDYVFDGQSTVPYQIDSPTHPINIYGASKLEGEIQAMRYNPQSIIIRTSWVYSPYGKNFVRTMLRLMSEKTEINVVDDQFGSPTYAADLAAAMITIAKAEAAPAGIYHFSNEGVINWYQFALAIREIANLNCKVNPIPTSAFPTPAKRPHFSAMNTTNITQVFPIALKPWQKSLEDCISRISR